MSQVRAPFAVDRAVGMVAVLDEDPELGEDLGAEEFVLARREALAEMVRFPAGRGVVAADEFDGRGSLGLLLLDGLLVRELTVGRGEYTCAELLGPGDVLQPWLTAGPDQSVATEVGWVGTEPVVAAVLGRDFMRRTARWPEITAAVGRRMMRRSHWLAFHLAVCGLRRVDDRLLLVLWHFADRWGKVTPQGVRLPIRLTHDVLATVVGARRPPVTIALGRLIDQGRLAPQPRSTWLLLGTPPSELREARRGVAARSAGEPVRARPA